MRRLVLVCAVILPALAPPLAEAQPRPRPGQPAAASAAFPVRSLEVEGNTLYATDALLAYAAGFAQQQQGEVTLITRAPGRQPSHDMPHFDGGAEGEAWNCLASGHSMRRHVDERGLETVNGTTPAMVVATMMFRDVPALHESHTDCLVSVHRRPRTVERR